MLAQEKLTAANWAKWQTAFDPTVPIALKQSHAAVIKGAPTGSWMGTGANPSTDMTIREIYNEFLFESATSEAGAVAMTSAYVAVELHIALVTGYSIGSGFYAFMSWVDPSYGADLVQSYIDDNLGDYGTPTGSVTIEWDQAVTNWDDIGDMDWWAF